MMTRTIERTGQFKKDYKREKKGAFRLTIEADLTAVLNILTNNGQLPPRYKDHPLTGN